jgi:hypothetical protein
VQWGRLTLPYRKKLGIENFMNDVEDEDGKGAGGER